MELYTLDDQFRKKDVIDQYISAIWTERYTDSGDAVLSVADTPANKALLAEGTFLSTPDSDEVMILESQDIQNGVLKVTGYTLDKFLVNRMCIPENDLEQQSFVITDPPGYVITFLVSRYVESGEFMDDATGPLGINGTYEVIDDLIIDDSAPGPTGTFTVARGPLYDEIKKIGQASNVGWSLTPQNITLSSYELWFKTYNGRNLTSDQSTYPVVRFSPSLDSLADIKELRSLANYKTVAYAISPGFDAAAELIGGAQFTGKAYAYPAAEFETNFNRRTMLVEISGITAEAVNDDWATYQAVMNRHAANALANNNFTKVVDGEVVPQTGLSFGTDYLLGDIVELQNVDGYIQKARVTEYIRSAEKNGFREYPTVSVI